jgi:hypothetical protein
MRIKKSQHICNQGGNRPRTAAAAEEIYPQHQVKYAAFSKNFDKKFKQQTLTAC